MRKLERIEFIEEVEKESRYFDNTIKGLLKEPGECVDCGTIDMFRKLIEDKGEFKINNVMLKKREEQVIVNSECDIEEIEEYEKKLGPFIEKKIINNTCYFSYYYTINKVVVEGDDILFKIYTTTEAAIEWGLKESTIRKAISKGKFRLGEDYRKAGRVTLIKEEAMIRVYGKKK